MADGYGVNPEALAATAKGIDDAIAELKTLGVNGSAAMGRGFSGLALRGMQVGHGGLRQAFEQFCERWSWGVRTLVQDGNQIAEDLHLSAGAYHQAEQYASGVLKDVVSDAMGNPHLTDEQVEKQSWKQVWADNPVNQTLHADYSAESYQKASDHIEQTWKTEGQDLARDAVEGPMGISKKIASATGHGQEFARAEDELFGSAPGHDGER
ncbi:hypothetical protein [Gandjariella thermophila]|uniref:Uncharacterized protein n=1 Tax=Gandjariella thermophila TaxID=1931992 RepID=A0A4D4JFR2_9PSEU|nr:hypothetical protein [Gandjariella thermophila]GDY33840.1 hypothetical protein GTS_54730 [Gandjariella thermophila]